MGFSVWHIWVIVGSFFDDLFSSFGAYSINIKYQVDYQYDEPITTKLFLTNPSIITVVRNLTIVGIGLWIIALSISDWVHLLVSWLMILLLSMVIVLIKSISSSPIVTFLMGVMLVWLGPRWAVGCSCVHMRIVLSHCFFLNFPAQYFIRCVTLPVHI